MLTSVLRSNISVDFCFVLLIYIFRIELTNDIKVKIY
jgi:hypothetical protein